jgi:hypothetical protein
MRRGAGCDNLEDKLIQLPKSELKAGLLTR